MRRWAGWIWGALCYTTRHKWYVLIECWKRGLIWRGIAHDWHKYLPSEFFPYARHFTGDISKGRDKTGYYKPENTKDPAFEWAWFCHWHRNDHHWQWWVEPRTSGMKARPMARAAWMEMVCDWHGAGRAQGTGSSVAWYKANYDKLILAPETRCAVEKELGIEGHDLP